MRKIIIITAISILLLSCIAALVFCFNIFGFKYWFIEKTGWFFPKAHEINTINDAEELGRIDFPDGARIENYSVNKCDSYVKYKPYSYKIRVVIPKEKMNEFIDYLKSKKNSNDTTKDSVREDMFIPELLNDFNSNDISYIFDSCYDTGDDFNIIPLHISTYVVETEGDGIVLLYIG